jgi:hypothetical protein
MVLLKFRINQKTLNLCPNSAEVSFSFALNIRDSYRYFMGIYFLFRRGE